MNKTIKDKINEAYAAARTSFMKSLTDNGVKFDDADYVIYVDNPETKTTWVFDLKCDEYDGEA